MSRTLMLHNSTLSEIHNHHNFILVPQSNLYILFLVMNITKTVGINFSSSLTRYPCNFRRYILTDYD